MTPTLKSLPLHLILAVRNPRHAERSARRGDGPPSADDATYAGTNAVTDPDLEGLARSLGTEDEPRLAEPPVVEEMPGGTYRLCAGERRVEAARLAGWTSIPCLVYPRMDPARAHTLSLVENMQRQPMHPLEEISALCISRLMANADARGIGREARRLLEDAWATNASSYSIMRDLERLLKDSGWSSERPDVTWKAHLDDLGISMAPWERKRKLRMLSIDPGLQEQLRQLDITEAALRSLGTLEPEEQSRVVEALVANPSLAHKVRRVARARRDGFYSTIEDALAEVQGFSPAASSPTSAIGSDPACTDSEPILLPAQVSSEQHSEPPGISTSVTMETNEAAEVRGFGALAPQMPSGPQVPLQVQDAVLQLLECADRLSVAMNDLGAYGGGVSLPEPWGGWSRDALSFIGGLLADRGVAQGIPARHSGA